MPFSSSIDKEILENASLVRMTPAEMQRRAKAEGAVLYSNEFSNYFEPWPREKINTNMKKLAEGKTEGGDDAELTEFVRLHPVLSRMARSSAGVATDATNNTTKNAALGALKDLFQAHDDIIAGKRSEDEAMRALMHGVFANFKRQQQQQQRDAS